MVSTDKEIASLVLVGVNKRWISWGISICHVAKQHVPQFQHNVDTILLVLLTDGFLKVADGVKASKQYNFHKIGKVDILEQRVDWNVFHTWDEKSAHVWWWHPHTWCLQHFFFWSFHYFFKSIFLYFLFVVCICTDLSISWLRNNSLPSVGVHLFMFDRNWFVNNTRRRCLCIHSTSVVQWNHTRSQHFQGLAMLCCSQLLSVSLISNPVQVARLEKHESLGVWQFAKKAFRCWYHWTQVKAFFVWTKLSF